MEMSLHEFVAMWPSLLGCDEKLYKSRYLWTVSQTLLNLVHVCSTAAGNTTEYLEGNKYGGGDLQC